MHGAVYKPSGRNIAHSPFIFSFHSDDGQHSHGCCLTNLSQFHFAAIGRNPCETLSAPREVKFLLFGAIALPAQQNSSILSPFQ